MVQLERLFSVPIEQRCGDWDRETCKKALLESRWYYEEFQYGFRLLRSEFDKFSGDTVMVLVEWLEELLQSGDILYDTATYRLKQLGDKWFRWDYWWLIAKEGREDVFAEISGVKELRNYVALKQVHWKWWPQYAEWALGRGEKPAPGEFVAEVYTSAGEQIYQDLQSIWRFMSGGLRKRGVLLEKIAYLLVGLWGLEESLRQSRPDLAERLASGQKRLSDFACGDQYLLEVVDDFEKTSTYQLAKQAGIIEV